MKQVNDLIDVLNGSNYVDCYVSTDESEVEYLLIGQGFVSIDSVDRNISYLIMDKERYGYVYPFKGSKTGSRIDCVDIPLDDALKIQQDIGFIPM